MENGLLARLGAWTERMMDRVRRLPVTPKHVAVAFVAALLLPVALDIAAKAAQILLYTVLAAAAVYAVAHGTASRRGAGRK